MFISPLPCSWKAATILAYPKKFQSDIISLHLGASMIDICLLFIKSGFNTCKYRFP
jgi:hypothetical protein